MRRHGEIERYGVVWEYWYEAGQTGQNGPDFWSPDDDAEVEITDAKVIDDSDWEGWGRGDPLEWAQGDGREAIVAEILDKEENPWH